MSSKRSYKVVGMEEIPEDWEVVELREIADDFISGGTPSTSKPEFWDGEIPWMRSASITNRYVDQGEKHISKAGLENSATNIVPKGNILVATRVSIGNVAINNIDVAISQDLTGVVIRKEMADPEYVYWALRKSENRIKHLVQGSTIKGVLREDLKSLPIPLPKLPEQQRIASVLSTTDEAAQKTDQIIRETRRLSKGLIQQVLTKGLGHSEFKQTEIGEIPYGWEVASLGDCMIRDPQNGIYRHQSCYGRGTQIVRIDDFYDGLFVRTTGFERVQLSDEEISAYELRPRDILVNRVNSLPFLGKAAIVPSLSEPTVFESNMMRFTSNPSLLLPEYAIYWLLTPLAQHHFQSRAKRAVAQSSVNQGDVRSLRVAKPPLGEQRRIVDLLSSVDRKADKEKQKKQHLARLRRGLMQDLLTGKARVRVD